MHFQLYHSTLCTPADVRNARSCVSGPMSSVPVDKDYESLERGHELLNNVIEVDRSWIRIRAKNKGAKLRLAQCDITPSKIGSNEPIP